MSQSNESMRLEEKYAQLTADRDACGEDDDANDRLGSILKEMRVVREEMELLATATPVQKPVQKKPVQEDMYIAWRPKDAAEGLGPTVLLRSSSGTGKAAKKDTTWSKLRPEAVPEGVRSLDLERGLVTYWTFGAGCQAIAIATPTSKEQQHSFEEVTSVGGPIDVPAERRMTVRGTVRGYAWDCGQLCYCVELSGVSSGPRIELVPFKLMCEDVDI